MVQASDNEDVFRRNVKGAYQNILKDDNFTLRGVGMRQDCAINTILDGENIEIIENECSSVLFPYFGEYYNLLFVVSSRKNSEVTGADASIMLNLLYKFDMW